MHEAKSIESYSYFMKPNGNAIESLWVLWNHLNLYRSLFENKNKIPEIVYMKYRKNFEYPDESDWDEIIEYHPHITKKVNKYYLY